MSETENPNNILIKIIKNYQSIIKDMLDVLTLVYETMEEDNLLRGVIHNSIDEYTQKLLEAGRLIRELQGELMSLLVESSETQTLH